MPYMDMAANTTDKTEAIMILAVLNRFIWIFCI